MHAWVNASRAIAWQWCQRSWIWWVKDKFCPMYRKTCCILPQYRLKSLQTHMKKRCIYKDLQARVHVINSPHEENTALWLPKHALTSKNKNNRTLQIHDNVQIQLYTGMCINYSFSKLSRPIYRLHYFPRLRIYDGEKISKWNESDRPRTGIPVTTERLSGRTREGMAEFTANADSNSKFSLLTNSHQQSTSTF
jgi:hypothetical protein